MADFAKSTTLPSPASILIPANSKISELLAGEDIAQADACYVKSDGKVWRSNGTSANAAAKVDGFAPVAAKAGAPVTLVFDTVWGWANAGTPGGRLYLDTNAGGLDTAATTGGTAPVGYIIDTKRVFLGRSHY